MNRPMRKQVRDETFKLLAQYGATGWKVRFNPRLTRALGRCFARAKVIEYQPRYMEQNDMAQVLGTIQHEVAHALAGAGHGHDAHWARIARDLGLENPSAVNHTATLTKKFTGACPSANCDNTVQADRRKQTACGKCCKAYAGGLYSPRFAFVWTRNA